jgi:invasion protein IalB
MRNVLLPVAASACLMFTNLAHATDSQKSPEQTPAAVKIKRTEIIAADNWTVTCTVADQPNAKRHCSAELRILKTENNQQIAVFAWIVALQDAKATSAISVPSGVLIGPGVQMKVDDKEPKSFVFNACQPDHCEVLIPLDEATVKSLLSATTAEFTVTASNGNSAKFTANVKGFEEALGLLKK